MNANEVVLWLAVAAIAYLLGEGRINLRRAHETVHPTDQGASIPNQDAETACRVYRRHTLDRLIQRYNLEELQQLAFDVGLRHDNIAGGTTQTYAMELLEHCERRGMLQYLLAAMR